jgi:hypothetical protein
MKNLEMILPELNDLNIHIIYLVGDLRGILNSRTKLYWGEDLAKLKNKRRLFSFSQISI